jgi:hypothetical protein
MYHAPWTETAGQGTDHARTEGLGEVQRPLLQPSPPGLRGSSAGGGPDRHCCAVHNSDTVRGTSHECPLGTSHARTCAAYR